MDAGLIHIYNVLPQQLLAKLLIQRPEPTGAADHPVGHGVAPQFYPLALPIGLLAIQRHSILELFLHHIGYRRGCRHAFLHHRYRCLGLPDIAFSGLRFTMSTFVAGSIVIHHIHLGRYNHQFRANKLFPNPYHSAAALGTDPFLLRQLTDHLLVFQTFGQFFLGSLGIPGMCLHRCRFPPVPAQTRRCRPPLH